MAVVKKTDLMVQLVLDWSFFFRSRISKFYKTDIVNQAEVLVPRIVSYGTPSVRLIMVSGQVARNRSWVVRNAK